MTTEPKPAKPKTTKSDFSQQIMDFRAAYLRAVARASVDERFRQRLTTEGQSLKVLREEFGYDCPWALTLELKDDPRRGPRLNPAKGRVMTLPYWGEAITIYIPRKPSGSPATQLDALAAYYQENPWFLRTKEVAQDSSQGIPPQAAAMVSAAVFLETDERQEKPQKYEKKIVDPPRRFDEKWVAVNVDNDRYDLGDNIEDFISLAAAIFNAVALAWTNETLWTELTVYTGDAKEESRARTIGILNEWLGYNYPWQLDLIIQEDKTAKYVPYTQSQDVNRGKWINTTPPKLMLTIPWMSGAESKAVIKEDPSEADRIAVAKADEEAAREEVKLNQNNPSVAIMGLALYNTDGAGYPFTCG